VTGFEKAAHMSRGTSVYTFLYLNPLSHTGLLRYASQSPDTFEHVITPGLETTASQWGLDPGGPLSYTKQQIHPGRLACSWRADLILGACLILCEVESAREEPSCCIAHQRH